MSDHKNQADHASVYDPEQQNDRDQADTPPPGYAVPTQKGTAAIEAAQSSAVWTPALKWSLYIGLGLTAYVYSLDGSTTYLYLAIVTSSFTKHSLLGAIQTVTALTTAVGKPIAAKFANVLGRAEAYALALVFYTVGYIILASCSEINAYAAGSVIRSFGYTAYQILEQIVVADVTTLRWRGLVSSSISLPFFVNGFVGSNIASDIIRQSGWRWGYGMFAILIPATTFPLLATLGWSQRKAYKLGLVHTTKVHQEMTIKKKVEKKAGTWAGRMWNFLDEMDAGGLLLFTAAWCCVLLPLTLVNGTSLKWSTPKMIALLVVGGILFIAFVAYEARIASYPIIPARFLINPTVCACGLIAFFDFVSFYVQFTYQYSFIYITKDWSLTNQNYFATAHTIALTLFGILGGSYIAWARRYKWLLVTGLFIRLFGVGLMIHSKGTHGSTAELVMVQIIQGMGGGIAAMSTRVAAQASVPHQDVAAVIAFVLLLAEVGGSIGGAISSAMWRNTMPHELNVKLAGLANSTEIETIFGDITSAVTYPIGSPIREGIISAYDHVMKNMLIVATVIAIFPTLIVFIPKDVYLPDVQNLVEHKATDQGIVDDDSSLHDGGKTDSRVDRL